ncbi:uncharacterized protein LOC122527761 [Frieseomelitta varia]|uniref:uncharacterized protein LOC122527761 n=1 Tax=Frieseomelitta varia TaxID=561572 RepID=UPI001CB6A6E6|nr:uncharacterized protein LOC122527761 [Frieseomelitta varia]
MQKVLKLEIQNNNTSTMFMFVLIIVPVQDHPIPHYFLNCRTRRVAKSHSAVEFRDNTLRRIRSFLIPRDKIEHIDATIINGQFDILSRKFDASHFFAFLGENPKVALKPRIFSTASTSPNSPRILCLKM